MEQSQEVIAKLIETYQFSLPFSNKTDSMDYPSMRKALEAQGELNHLLQPSAGGFTKDALHPYSFEVIQNRENFFVKGGTSKWHKNIVIPQTLVKQQEKNDKQEKQMGGQFQVEMKCWAKKENGSYVEINLENNSGAKRLSNSNSLQSTKNNNNSNSTNANTSSNSSQVFEKIVKFSSLKFSSTGYLESEIAKSPSGQNNQNPENIIKFRIYIYIYKIVSNNSRQIYDIYFSHPITVSARKKSRQSRASFSVLMEPFLPKSFEQFHCKYTQGIIELKDFLSKASERHKVKDQIICFQETLIEAFMTSEESVVILHFNTEGLEKEQVKKLEQYLKPLKNKQIKLCFSESDLNRLKKDATYGCLDKDEFIENYKKAYYELTKVLLNTRNKLSKFNSNFSLISEQNISKFEDIQKKNIKQAFEFNQQWVNTAYAERIKTRINNEYSSNQECNMNPYACMKTTIDYSLSSQSSSPQKVSQIKIKNNLKDDCQKTNKSTPGSFDSHLLTCIESEQNTSIEKNQILSDKPQQSNQIPQFTANEVRSDRNDSFSNGTTSSSLFQVGNKNQFCYIPDQQKQSQFNNISNNNTLTNSQINQQETQQQLYFSDNQFNINNCNNNNNNIGSMIQNMENTSLHQQDSNSYQNQDSQQMFMKSFFNMLMSNSNNFKNNNNNNPSNNINQGYLQQSQQFNQLVNINNNNLGYFMPALINQNQYQAQLQQQNNGNYIDDQLTLFLIQNYQLLQNSQ